MFAVRSSYIFPDMSLNRTSIIYGVLDLLVAGLYVYIFVALVPSRSTLFTAVAMSLCALLATGGAGLISGAAWGRKVAAAASGAWLLACAVLILLLVSSAAYLHGIYNGVGQAGAAIGLLMAALAFELVGLLPALQLAHIVRVNREAREIKA